ncbi:ABC transporter permease [Actinomycetota bacterium]|nr:ABC transporter permease [Actinomycetota bacterium]
MAVTSLPAGTLAVGEPGPTTRGARRAAGRRSAPMPAGTSRVRGPAPYLLVGPAVVLFLGCIVAPALYALYLSLRGLQVSGEGMFGGQTTEVFVGLRNYREALGDAELWHSIGRMLAVAVIGVPLTVVLAAAFALSLDAAQTRLRGLFRILIFLPYAVPGVIASLMWGFLYLPGTSPIGGNHVDYFGPHTIFLSVANVAIWCAVGFNMLVMYTSLRSLPPELYESARLDGCSERQVSLRIKLPLIRPAVTMCALFSLLGALQLYNEPMALKPLANSITTTWVPLMKVQRDAFGENNVYGASATALFIAVSIVAITVIANYATKLRSGGNR